MSIRSKLTLIATLPVLVICVIGWYWVRESLYTQIQTSAIRQSQIVVDKINDVFKGHEAYWRAYCNSESVRTVLRESNMLFENDADRDSRILAAEQLWRKSSATSMTDLANTIIHSDLSQALIHHLKVLEAANGYRIYGEIFFTNRYGLNVAQTGWTSDYIQNDEHWWVRAHTDGVYHDDVSFDESAGVFSTAICIKVNDEHGHFLGVAKVIVNIQEVIEVLDQFAEDGDNAQVTHIALLRNNREVIHETGSNKFERFRDGAEYLKTGEYQRPVDIIESRLDERSGTAMYSVIHAPINRSAFADLEWILVYEQPVEYVFASISQLRNSMFGFAVVVFPVVLLLSLWVCMRLSSRINRLVEATGKLGKEEFDVRVETTPHDELGRLGESFNNALDELRDTQAERQRLSTRLLDASRKAGMTEVATGVLHNVEHVLKSLSLSSRVIAQHVSDLHVDAVVQAVDLMDENPALDSKQAQSGEVLERVPQQLHELGMQLKGGQSEIEAELQQLSDGVEHVLRTVQLHQQFAASRSGVGQQIDLHELIDDALRLQHVIDGQYGVKLIRDYGEIPKVSTDRHFIMLALVNIISNAKHAMYMSRESVMVLQVRTFMEDGYVYVSISDNGVGIHEKQIKRIFQYGYTNKVNCHGNGLHSALNAIRAVKGELTVHSDGLGHGAEFTIGLPVSVNTKTELETASLDAY